MHDVIVKPTEVTCSCGFKKKTLTGSEAFRIGYTHAQVRTPSIVRDQRKETEK